MRNDASITFSQYFLQKNPRCVVIIDFDLNTPLKSLFHPLITTTKNLQFGIYHEIVVNVSLLMINWLNVTTILPYSYY